MKGLQASSSSSGGTKQPSFPSITQLIKQFRSTFYAQLMVQTHRTLPLQSTSAIKKHSLLGLISKQARTQTAKFNDYIILINREETCWKVLRDAKIEPPIQTLYFLSGGATTLIFMLLGAKAEISLLILSAMPGNMVVPPESTMLPYRSFLMSTSHFIMELYVVSWMPAASIPTMDGWYNTSGHLKRSAPMVITCPSGNS